METEGAAETKKSSRVVARFLDGVGAEVDVASSKSARFRLPLLGAASSPKTFCVLWMRRPRPVASVGARSSTMSMTRFLGIGRGHAGRSVDVVAVGPRSAFDAPGDIS